MRRLTSTHWFRVGLASVGAAGILTALFALAGHSEISVTLQSALVHAAGMTVLVSLTMPWLRRCVEGQPAPLGWGLKIAALLPLAVVGTVLACGVITLLGFRPREPFWTCFDHDLSICVLITLTLGISLGLYDAQRRRLDAVTAALRERELEHERARKMALEARLASLEARLQPHFMFNTLNAISALIQDNPEEAERTIERLAALLRFALDATERGLVPLDHELKIVTDYVEIGRALLRAFLIDDEPLALQHLARLLEATGRVEVVGRATNPVDGLAAVAAKPVDVLFLDIHMPGLSGFQVVERVPPGPMVVFTTAHDEHAVRAFEVNAVDYLLKPVERKRLDDALDRVAARRAGPGDDGVREALGRLAQHLRAAPFLDHLAARMRDRVQLIPVQEVTHVLAKARATYAVTASTQPMLDATLAALERRLDPQRFLRINRGILVNLAWVAELRADPDGHLAVRLKDAARSELAVSRDRVRPLKERLGLA